MYFTIGLIAAILLVAAIGIFWETAMEYLKRFPSIYNEKSYYGKDDRVTSLIIIMIISFILMLLLWIIVVPILALFYYRPMILKNDKVKRIIDIILE